MPNLEKWKTPCFIHPREPNTGLQCDAGPDLKDQNRSEEMCKILQRSENSSQWVICESAPFTILQFGKNGNYLAQILILNSKLRIALHLLATFFMLLGCHLRYCVVPSLLLSLNWQLKLSFNFYQIERIFTDHSFTGRQWNYA